MYSNDKKDSYKQKYSNCDEKTISPLREKV